MYVLDMKTVYPIGYCPLVFCILIFGVQMAPQVLLRSQLVGASHLTWFPYSLNFISFYFFPNVINPYNPYDVNHHIKKKK